MFKTINLPNYKSRYVLLGGSRRLRYIFIGAVAASSFLYLIIYLQLNYGLFQVLFLENDIRKGFDYPLDISNFSGTVDLFIKSGSPQDFRPPPINLNYSRAPIVQNADSVPANESVGLLIIVKSAAFNYAKRIAIRRTWADPAYLSLHNISKELPTKVVFMSGIPKDIQNTGMFSREGHFRDIIVARVEDSYKNLSFKTFLAFRWALQHVKNFKYLMVLDDDMYVGLANAVKFINEIDSMEVEVVTSKKSGEFIYFPRKEGGKENCASCIRLKERPLIMGFPYLDSSPFRNAGGWFLTMEDYPYNYFPPYVAGAATIFDSAAVSKLYYGSFFTKHFPIDDVYVGIIARKLGITITGSDLFDASYRKTPGKLKRKFSEMIAIHGLKCPEQLVELWRTRDIERVAGCAKLPIIS